MVERFKTYFERLQRLSSEDLDRSADKLVRCEKRDVALLIAHLAEISRRKVELERGYKNLFDYGVRRLNLSEGSVALRLQVANVSRRFPQILAALAENRISLTVAGLLAPHLSEENVERLLSDGAGMTKRAVEEYLVSLRPKPVFTPSIRKQPSPGGNGEAFHSQPPPATEPAPPAPELQQPPRKPERSTPPLLAPARPDQFNFRFAADRQFKEKFERLAEVLGGESPGTHGRGAGAGPGCGARPERPEAQARAPARESAEAKCARKKISSGRDFERGAPGIPVRLASGSRAGARESGLPMRVPRL